MGGINVGLRAEPMRVVITGATGFVGGAIARALARDGAEIHALVRPTSDRSVLNDVPIHFHEGDITEPGSCSDVLRGANWVIHAAGRLGEAGVPEETYRRVHVEGTRNLLTAALSVENPPRVLHVSSPGVLGPITGDPASEDAPYSPTNPYERTKTEAEQVAREFAAQGLPVVIARPEFMYGPRDRHVLKLFQAIEKGRFFYINGGRHFCHPTFIGDAVAGMLLCLSRGRSGGVYHITGPRPVTFRELGETIATALGVRLPRISLPRWLMMPGVAGLEVLARATGRIPPLTQTGVAFFSEDRRFSWKKAHDELGYAPGYDLAAGIAITVAWYREHGWI
jgi:nucleoside-diphosphate-sugar epimerase